MTDVSWIIETGKEIRTIFESMFYLFAMVLLLIGIIIEYFKLPVGGIPSFAPLVGRVIVAFLLLASYSDVANLIANVSDALAKDINQTNDFFTGVEIAWSKVQNLDWGWTSVGQTLIWFLGYVAYSVLYLSIFFFDAAILYIWVLCFILSPLLIALFILPQTAGATKALYRTLLEVASWKVVWSLMAAILWKSTLTQLNSDTTNDPNFITTIAYIIMLSLSIIGTPFIVKSLMGPGLSGFAGMAMAGAAAISSAGVLTPAGIKSMGTGLTKKGAGFLKSGVKFSGRQTAQGFKSLYQNRVNRSSSTPQSPKEPRWFKQMNKEIPPPHYPPGWMESQLKKEKQFRS